MRFLPDLLESIMGQTFKDFNVLIIDNGSTDGVETFLREHHPGIAFIRNARNLGFSVAHNQGIRYAIEHWPQAELVDRFVLLTNPDIVLNHTYLEELMKVVRTYPQSGAFGGKLLRAFGENVGDDVLKEVVRSDRIDSVGLNPHRNRTVSDRGAGELDTGQYQKEEQVFGISGALVLYRASALEEVRFKDEILDADFFAYKEDVDLAWRLQHRGWDATYAPNAIAYHYRGMYGPEKSGWRERLWNRRQKSPLRNFFSTRNHWLLLIKNVRWSDLFFSFPWMFVHETGRLVYVLVFERFGWRAVWEALGLFPRMWKKRHVSLHNARRPTKKIRAWFR